MGNCFFLFNRIGGILGGILSGQPIIARFAMKSTPSILVSRCSIDINGNNVDVAAEGRHNPYVRICSVPIGEAMATCAIADHYLRYCGQVGGI